MLIYVDPQSKTAARLGGIRLKDFGLDERAFQSILFDNLDRLLPDDELFLIMQSRRWREEPDLMALDSNGSLYIFELKVWESTNENLLQVLRYGQLFGSYKYEDLNRLYQSFNRGTKSLIESMYAKFGVEINEEDFNNNQKFIVMVNGLDIKTREAIKYWRGAGLDVRPWVYRVYNHSNSEMLLELNPFRVEDDPYEDVLQGYYILNTNYNNDPIDHDYMIQTKRAAAFFAPWKRKIDRLNKGDIVFLYRSGLGIVAFGKASGKVEKKDYHNDPNFDKEEHYMNLYNFVLIDPVVSASEAKAVTGANIIFRQTMFGLDNNSGKNLLHYIKTR